MLNVLLLSFTHLFGNRVEGAWGSDGPATAAQLELWVAQILTRLDAQQRAGFKRFLRTSSGFSTAYAGAGCFESIVGQLASYLGIRRPPGCLHAWELHKKARLALMCPDKGDAPQHVFGDLTGIFPPRAIRKLCKVQKVLLQEHKKEVTAGLISHQK